MINSPLGLMHKQQQQLIEETKNDTGLRRRANSMTLLNQISR